MRLCSVAIAFPKISDTVSADMATVREEGGGKQLLFFSGLEAQGEINRLLNRLFGSYD